MKKLLAIEADTMKKFESWAVRAFFLGIFSVSTWTLLEVVNQGKDIASIKTAISYLTHDAASFDNKTASK